MFFRRSLSLRGLALFGLDMLLVAAAVYAAHVAYYAIIEPTWAEGMEQARIWFLERLKTLFAAMAVHGVANFACGLYEPSTIASSKRTAGVSLMAVALATVVIVLLFFAKLKLHYGRGILLLGAILIWMFMMASRWLYRRVVGGGYFARPTLLVGEGAEAETILRLLQADENCTYQVFGIVRSQPATSSSPAFLLGIPVLGGLDNLSDYVHAYHIQTVLVSTAVSKEREVLRRLRPLRYTGVALLDFVSLHEELAGAIPLGHIDDEWFMHAAAQGSVFHIRKLKRILDVAVSLAGLVLSAPLSLLAAILVRLDSPGPIFYRQVRTGKNGHPFTLIKFRTMRRDAEAATGAVWAEKFDARITRTGRFLRTSRLDEIPQLYNVLRGEMSLVGPRPERPEFVATLTAQIPFYQERLLVPPGITGWAQIQYPYAASVEAARLKLQYDLYYIKHMSLALDLTILLKTVKTILVGMRHSADETQPRVPALGEENPAPLRVLADPPSNPSSKSA